MKRCVLALAVVGLAACSSDSVTGATTPLALTFAATQTVAGHAITLNGAQGYACTYRLSVTTAGGDPADLAEWIDGEIDFRLTSSGAQSVSQLSSTDVQDWFGTDKVHAGGSASAARQFTWTGPFTATVLIRYIVTDVNSVSSDSRTATIPITC